MPSPAIPESPTARLLLELATQRASCELTFGQRTVLLRDGRTVDIAGNASDPSLAAFLVAADRLDEPGREVVEQLAREQNVGIEQALLELDLVEPEALQALRRAQLLERLVRALADEQASGDPTPQPRALAQVDPGAGFDTVSLVLDALARRASYGAAEQVGELGRARFVWVEGEARRRAAEWAELGDIPHAMSVATLFPRHPAAAARIAALVAAGLAQLSGSGLSGAPEAGSSSAPPPPSDAGSSRSRVITNRPMSISSLPMPMPMLGAPVNTEELHPLQLAPPRWWLPEARASLDDPLEPLESAVAKAEQNGTAAERAEAWLALAEGFRTHQRSLSEATRAAREAAAAAPDHAPALRLAAELSAASGHPELAYPYAMAWAAHTDSQQERARALCAASQYARRQGRPDAALVALRSAASAAPEDLRLQEQLARALGEAGDVQAAVDLALQTAEALRGSEAERALQLALWTTKLAPANLRGWTELARLLARSGRAALAAATLTRAARMQSDGALRERLRAAALSFAEQAGDQRAVAQICLEAHEGGLVESEQLVSALRATEAWPELAFHAERAALRASGSERAHLLAQAAEAQARLSGGVRAVRTAALLLARALAADPSYEHASHALRAHAESHRLLVIEALEATLRALPLAAIAERRALAEQLDAQLRDEAGAPLAAWLRTLMPELPLPLAPDRAPFDRQAEALQQALRAAPRSARARPALTLAGWLRRDPERRSISRKLYEKVLEIDPGQHEALEGLSSLLALEDDPSALDTLLSKHALHELTPEAQLALAQHAARSGKPELALQSALQALATEGVASHAQAEAGVLAEQLALQLDDAASRLRALRARAEHAPEPHARADALRTLSRLLVGSPEPSLQAAQRALAIEPDSLHGALLLLDHVDRLTSAASIPSLHALRAVLGDQPDVLRSLARASFAALDAEGQREALEALSARLPEDGFAARALVALRATGRDADALAAALSDALEPARFAAQTNYVAQRGLARLSELAGAERTLELALSAIEQLGEPARPLLAGTDSLAASVRWDLLRSAQLELRVAHASEAERPALLRKLSALHRERELGWAAVRCELRLLELVPDDREALAHLVALYAEHGELARLRDALEALAERTQDSEQKRALLLDTALVTARIASDPAQATLLVERAFAEGADEGEFPTREELRRGLGLLMEGSRERAFGVMLTLAQRAPSELSADLITEAFALAEHTLRMPGLALQAVSQGAFRHPDRELFVRALERFADGDQPELAIAALDEAAERCELPARQAELLLRAATLSEQRLDDPGRACLQLDRAYRALPERAVEERWTRSAARLFARDVRAGKRAYDRLRDTLHVRAKFGSTRDRASSLCSLARLAGEVYLNQADALGYVEAATAAIEADAELGPAERQDALDEVEALRAHFEQPEAASAARPSLRELEVPLLGLGLGLAHSAPTLRPHATSSAPPGSRARARILSASPSTTLNLGSSEPPLPLASLAPIDIRNSASPRAESAGSAVVGALLRGDGAAHKALSELLARERDAAGPVCQELLARARKQGFSVLVLRALRLASAGANRHALWRTSSQALAFVDGALRPPPGPKQRDLRAGRMENALLEARQTRHAAAYALLQQIVESASPLFRRSAASALGLSREPEPVRSGSAAQVLAELCQTFGVRHELFQAPSQDDRVSVFSAQPACIALGGRTPLDAGTLRYRLARALEYARSENILFASSSQPELQTLLAALRAAFAPPSAAPAQVPREAAALAADLWRTMPSKAQRALTARIGELDALPDPRVLRLDVLLRGARAGLFVTRELDLALQLIGTDGDPAELAVEPSEGALDRALQDNPFVRALLDYALSDAYLDALLDGS